MEGTLADQAALAQLWAAFSAGVATSLTPCVYPLIPITLALFGATAETGRGRSLLLALTYVTGIATTYTLLGVVSARTGALFGSLLGNPVVVAILSLLLFLLTLSTLDLVQAGFLGRLQGVAGRIGGRGFRGAFLMGTVSGLVAAPCAGPLLAVVLSIAAASQDAVWGGVLLFTYAIGMGLLFIVLGAFPGLIRRLPRSGTWLLGVKFLSGAALLMVVLFLTAPFGADEVFGRPELRQTSVFAGLVALGVGVAVVAYRREVHLLKLIAAMVIAVAGYGRFIATPPHPAPTTAGTTGEVRWITEFEPALQAAAKSGRIVMVDLFAEWCAACKELDALTFPDPGVQEMLQRNFVAARLDFTHLDEASEAIMSRYKVVGLPCILFLDGAGAEVPNSRITGFVPPAELLRHLENVRPK